jgi:hypothetical protein
MNVFPGASEKDPALFASTWIADTPAGREFVWAALDCPGAWAAGMTNRDLVLGRITASVTATPSVAEPCVVTSRLVAQDGRKFSTASAVYGHDGRLLGEAESVWIEVRN